MDISELPRDPAILQSYINTLLRDYYSSLDQLCRALDIPRADLDRRLAEVHLEYEPTLNKVW